MSRRLQIDNDGVPMSAFHQRWLRHASDVAVDTDECFGGDTLGHWNVSRINRLLDAFSAPVVQLPVPSAVMLSMARVGKPDRFRAEGHARRGLLTMPPLSFVTLQVGDDDVAQTMLVDGHHRMMALHLLGAATVPARVLPPGLADDVRIVEMSETVTFPTAPLPRNRVDLGEVLVRDGVPA